MKTKIELNIGELSLDGVSHMDQQSLGSVIEAELTRRLEGGSMPTNFLIAGTASQLDFGMMEIAANSDPRLVGRQIAKKIYSGFKKNRALPPHQGEALTKEPDSPKNQIQNTIE